VTAKKPLAPIPDKPESTWPCHCCSCHMPVEEFDPKCHTHGEGHGRRGCLKHEVRPQRCTQPSCGCVTDQDVENARHSEMEARGQRYLRQREHDQAIVEINTEDDPEELAALHAAKRKQALELQESQQQQFQVAVDAAVQRALKP
jgi:hypothetical protein